MSDRLIYESRKSKVFYRTDDSGAAFAVKVLNFEFPTPDDISQFHNEFDIIEGLHLAGVRNAIKKTRENGRHVLIMEWINGQPLKEAFRDKTGDIVDALHIAIAASNTLSEIHENQIIHRNVTPNNFLVDLQERRVWLIDFGISTNLNLKQAFIGNPDRIEGTVSYVSPEQTGRMNRTVDFRTDLYSFGVTLYEMLSGEVPFTGSDAMEVVHAHLAQEPVPLIQKNPDLPQVLSDIVDRLLAKNADDRYQSARGLRHDLEKCLAAFEKSGADFPAFPLGEADHSSIFRLPQKLYGREVEVAEIIHAYGAAAEGARYRLQIQTHPASDNEDPEVFNNMIVWDEDAHPWHDLGIIEIDRTLDWKESTLTTFSVNNMPKTLGVLPAKSIFDYNSLNYLRAHSELARKARILSYKVYGMVPPIPDNDNRNVSDWGGLARC